MSLTMLAGFIVLGSFFVLAIYIWRAGKQSALLTKEEEINEAVRKAVLVRDRLRRDPDYARRLRARFSR